MCINVTDYPINLIVWACAGSKSQIELFEYLYRHHILIYWSKIMKLLEICWLAKIAHWTTITIFLVFLYS